MSFVHTCVVMVPLAALAVGSVMQVRLGTDEGSQGTQAGVEGAALAFALVGLLGLIRFRTVVRDTREFTFVLVAIVAGAGVGGGRHLAAVGGTIVVVALLLGLERFGFGAPTAPSLRAKVSGREDAAAEYANALAAVANRVEPVAMRCGSERSGAIYTFELVARPGENLASVANALRHVPNTLEVFVSRLQRGKSAVGDED
jgi:hypothetical protein